MAAAAAVAIGASTLVATTALASHSTERFAGEDRFETAVAMSQEEENCAIALVNGRNFPDALAAGTTSSGYSVLLTEANSLPEVTADEIARLYSPDECDGSVFVLIIGGTSAVSAAVREEVIDIVGYLNVERVAGANRYETALEVAEWWGYGDTVILVSGENFPDALVAGPMSASTGYPIILNSGSSVRADVAQWMVTKGITNVKIIGGEAAIPASVEAQLEGPLGITVERIAGNDRYATAVKVAEWLLADGYNGGELDGAMLANGEGYADALAASYSAYDDDKPILLVKRDSIPSAVQSFLRSKCGELDDDTDPIEDDLTGIGGPAVISDAVLDAAYALAVCEEPAVTSATIAVRDLKARVVNVTDGAGGDDEDGAKLTATGVALGTVANAWTINFVNDTSNTTGVAVVSGTTITYTDNFGSLTPANFVTNWNNSAAKDLFVASKGTGAGDSDGLFTGAPDNIAPGTGTLGSYDATLVITTSTAVDAPGELVVWSNQNPSTGSALLSTATATRTPATWPTAGSTTATYTWNDVNDQLAPTVGVSSLLVGAGTITDAVTGEDNSPAGGFSLVPLAAPAS